MSVTLAPAMSVIVRVAALTSDQTRVLETGALGEIFDRDDALLVLGPLYSSESTEAKLAEMGLAFYDDYFDLPYSGGTVPDWCMVRLELRSASPHR